MLHTVLKYVFIAALFLLSTTSLFAQMESEPNDGFGTADVVDFTSQDVTIQGMINPDMDDDFYAITVNQPGLFVITTSNIPTGMNLSMELYDDASNPPLIQRNSSSTFITYYRICTPGTYYIKIADVSVGIDESMDVYTVNIRFATADVYECNDDFSSAHPILAGTLIQAQINSDGDLDYYRLDIEQAGVFDIQVTNIPTGMNLSVELYDAPFGSPITQANSSASFSTNFLVCMPGTYYIKVSDVSVGVDENEDFYSLEVNLNTQDSYECNNDFMTASPIEREQQIMAQIYSDGDQDYYRIELSEPGTFLFTMTNIPQGMNLSIEVFNSLFVSLDQVNSSSPFTHQFAICESGTYYILIEDVSVGIDSSPEIYNFLVQYDTTDEYECNNTFPTASPILCNTTIRGNLATTSDRDIFSITIPNETDLQVNVFTIPNVIDADLVLADNFETPLRNIDANNGSSLQLNVESLAAGEYFLILRDDGSNNSSTDLYTISLACPNVTSITETIELSSSTLYPTITISELNLDYYPSSTLIEVTIVNMFGQYVYNKKYPVISKQLNSLNIDVSALSVGHYSLQLQEVGQPLRIGRFIKQ